MSAINKNIVSFSHDLHSSDELQLCKQHCLFLEHLIQFGQVSPMDNIIVDFKSLSSLYLSQLANEINIYRSSSKERAELIDFAHFLRDISLEIENMLISHH